MSDYQFFTGPAGALQQVSVDVECRSDPEAYMIAVRLAAAQESVEAWQGERYVCRVAGWHPSSALQHVWSTNR